MAGWWLGRTAGGRALAGLADDERERLLGQQRRYGPLAVVLSRPLPLVAEAAAIMAGATGMKWREFLLAAGSGNLAIALFWSVAGTMGGDADSLQWVLVGSIVVPVLITWLVLRLNMQTPSREL
jgi:membrane protein DedA with SNARE-associated domain